MALKCQEGKAAGDEMEVDVPTAAHRSRIKELASRALDELPKPLLEKKRKHDLGPSEVQPPLPAPPPPAAPHLTAPPPPDQGAGTPLAVPPAALQLDLGQGSSALTPLLQLLEGNRAVVHAVGGRGGREGASHHHLDKKAVAFARLIKCSISQAHAHLPCLCSFR